MDGESTLCGGAQSQSTFSHNIGKLPSGGIEGIPHFLRKDGSPTLQMAQGKKSNFEFEIRISNSNSKYLFEIEILQYHSEHTQPCHLHNSNYRCHCLL
jgi:hypothetical protein